MIAMQTTGHRFGPVRGALLILATVLVVALAACGSTPADKNDTMAIEKLYEEARDNASSGNWEQAMKMYEKLEARAAGTPLAQQAQLDLAYAQYKSSEKEKALATLERFIKLNPSSPALDYAFYLKGLVNFNENLGLLGSFARQDLSERDQQASRDSYQSFRQLVTRFPDSKYAADSQLRMNFIINSLAAYEVHVARYYYRRGAYLAAANRAQQALQEFQNSPAVEEALYILTLSYDRLAMNDLRDDAQRVLATNFPESRFVKEGFGEVKKAWWQLW